MKIMKINSENDESRDIQIRNDTKDCIYYWFLVAIFFCFIYLLALLISHLQK